MKQRPLFPTLIGNAKYLNYIRKIKDTTNTVFIRFLVNPAKRNDGCENEMRLLKQNEMCFNLIRKATIHLQNQSKTPFFLDKINGIQMDF